MSVLWWLHGCENCAGQYTSVFRDWNCSVQIYVNMRDFTLLWFHIISTVFNYPSCHDIDHGNHKCMAIHYIIPNAVHFTEGKLDELTARRHLKSPWSLSGRSLHFILVTKRSRSWSRMNPFCSMSIGPPIPEIRLFQNLNLKIQGQSHGQGQTQWLHLMPRIQSKCLLFISWQWDHFLLRFGKCHIWTWMFKVWLRSNLMVTFKA